MASIPELVARTSLDHNPPNADIHVSTHGTDWLWAVFAIEAVSMLGMFGLTFMVRSRLPYRIKRYSTLFFCSAPGAHASSTTSR